MYVTPMIVNVLFFVNSTVSHKQRGKSIFHSKFHFAGCAFEKIKKKSFELMAGKVTH